MDSQDRAKDIWEKLPVVSGLIASVLVPVVLAIVGNAYSNALKQSENRVKYTELAISILKEKPAPDNQNIRSWAVDVIDQYSGIRMSAKTRDQLLATRLGKGDLSEADLRRFNFKRARFNMSNFLECIFSFGDFDGSAFDNSSFRNTRFGQSDFRGADLSRIKIDATTKLPK